MVAKKSKEENIFLIGDMLLYNFIGTQPWSFMYVLSMAALSLQQQC